jgi:hypothetical protein
VVTLLDGNADAVYCCCEEMTFGPIWCQMQCFGAKCGHMVFCLTLLDGTVEKKGKKLLGGGAFNMGLFCIRLYTILIRLYGLYTVYIRYRGLRYTPFPHPYLYHMPPRMQSTLQQVSVGVQNR